MERVQEIRAALEDLEKSGHYEKMKTLLKELTSLPMNKETLQKSKIGILVNRLRKQETCKEVAKLATNILIVWKKILVEDGTLKSSKNEPEKSSTNNEDVQELIEKYKTSDATRDKCIEMLTTALCTDTPELLGRPDELILETAQAVERALFEEFGGSTDAKYKAKFRSKYLNLKDRSNPQLRAVLLQGLVTPTRFISMTAAEMASEERRASDLALQERNLNETKAIQDTSAETDQFKCGRCKQRKCKYYQLQTRSADEPMTTFVTCINCNNRWKFC